MATITTIKVRVNGEWITVPTGGTGTTGPQGPTGATGAQGPAGTNGTNGTSYTGPKITGSSTPPSSPSTGDVWIDTSA